MLQLRNDNSPCKGCSNRSTTCHIWCPEYIEYQKEVEWKRPAVDQAEMMQIEGCIKRRRNKK